MDIGAKQTWEAANTEYQAALEQYRHFSSLRRQDMLFATTVQGAVLAIVGSRLLSLQPADVILSTIAAAVAFLGLNSERRLSVYMAANARRAREIEAQHGMSVLTLGYEAINKSPLLLPNTVTFPIYYALLLVAWLFVWLWNVWA